MEKTNLTPRARELRKNATPQERKLWYMFLSKHPAHFRRQHPIGPYIADFFCHSAQLVIEVDGSGHFQPEGFEETFAEMSSEQKNAVSHRGKATRKLIEYLKDLK